MQLKNGVELYSHITNCKQNWEQQEFIEENQDSETKLTSTMRENEAHIQELYSMFRSGFPDKGPT